jgi:hypothetical protein
MTSASCASLFVRLSSQLIDLGVLPNEDTPLPKLARVYRGLH